MSVMTSRREWLRRVAVHTAERLDGADPAEATGLSEQEVAALSDDDQARIREAVTEVRYRLLRVGAPR